MGRKRTKNTNLPEGMRARIWSSGKTYYYLESNEGGKRRTKPLGSNMIDALAKYCEFMKTNDAPAYTFLEISRRYIAEIIPKKARKTQADDLSRIKKLQRFFCDDVSIDLIEPSHLGMYKRWRLKLKKEEDDARIAEGKKPMPGDGKVAINREMTLFSGIWNYARNEGFTKLQNPAEGVDRFKEVGRKGIYTEDEVLEAVYKIGDQALKDTLDLAYLTGQRRADVLAMTETMIRPAKYRQDDGSFIEVETIPVKQEKTGNKVRMIIDGELATLLKRISDAKKARKVVNLSGVISKSLLVNEDGEQLTMQMLRRRFENARRLAAEAADASGHLDLSNEIKNFQFRDLRAKAGSDKAEETGSMLEAQKMLGHSQASTTEIYVRHRRGALVKPTR